MRRGDGGLTQDAGPSGPVDQADGPDAASWDAAALRDRWLALTRVEMPALATARGWPVRVDHCFQRILLDNACGDCWYDHIAGRPAYAHARPAILARAIALGEAAVAGTADLDTLNARSLDWRRRR